MLMGARALALIAKADREPGDQRETLSAARDVLAAQARTTPGNPYLWARLAAVELALGGRPDRALALLQRSFEVGRNAVAAWPTRVAIGFRLWNDADEALRARILDEAVAMWLKLGDRAWSRPEMRVRLARMTAASGLVDVVTPAIAVSPEAFAAWNNALAQALEDT